MLKTRSCGKKRGNLGNAVKKRGWHDAEHGVSHMMKLNNYPVQCTYTKS